jgi:hypothetical protein
MITSRHSRKVAIWVAIVILLLILYRWLQKYKLNEHYANLRVKSFEGNRTYPQNDEEEIGILGEEEMAMGEDRRDPTAILPKTVFMYWHEEVISNPLVQKNVEYLQKALPAKGYTFRIFNEKSIATELSPEEMKYQGQSKQHFADYVRVFLLHKYGGYWFDSTIIVNELGFLDGLQDAYRRRPFDVFLFELRKNRAGERHDGMYLENWFIVAPEKSIFMRDMYTEYKRALDIGFPKYKEELLRKGVNGLYIFKDPNDVYLMQHAIFRLLIGKNKYRISYDYAENSMFRLQDKCGWDNNCLTDKLLHMSEEEEIYGVKLIGGQREFINQHRNGEIPTIFSRLLAKLGL